MKTLQIVPLMIGLFIGSASSDIQAQPAKSGGPRKEAAITQEQRQDMAIMHEKMAACLRSDKPLKDCREEMWSSCDKLREGGCLMMGMGRKGHHGMMHGDWEDADSGKK